VWWEARNKPIELWYGRPNYITQPVILVHRQTEQSEDDKLVQIYNFLSCGKTESTWHVGNNFALVPAQDDKWCVEHMVEWNAAREIDVLWDNQRNVTLATTNPTWSNVRSKSGSRGGKPANNRLSYGTPKGKASVLPISSFHELGFPVRFNWKSTSEIINLLKKNGVFWDLTPCGFCKNRRFGGT
jgi:hypothetical protein